MDFRRINTKVVGWGSLEWSGEGDGGLVEDGNRDKGKKIIFKKFPEDTFTWNLEMTID